MRYPQVCTLFIAFLLPLISSAQFKKLEGVYLAVQFDKNKAPYLEENCWSKQVDQLIIESATTFREYDGQYEHMLTFNGFHAESYLIYAEEQNNDTIVLKAILADEPNEETHEFRVVFDNHSLWLYHKDFNSEFHFIREKDRKTVRMRKCPEESIDSKETLDKEDLSAALKNFLKPLFNRESPEFSSYISPDGFDYIYPGPGVHQLKERSINAETMFDEDYFKAFVEKSSRDNSWSQLPLFYVEKLPFRCTDSDVKKGVYILVNDDATIQEVSVLIFTEDGPGDSNSMTLEMINAPSGLKVHSIAISECGA